ncbi:MAG: hypothetical protein K6D97_05125 [Clostridia bacterium]|nr:hypothetical protein [Clostridia bacterium]
MDYQAVITSYSNKRIDMEKFKKDLEIARPLKQRQKYRAVEMSEFWRIFNANTTDILLTNEVVDNIDIFMDKVNRQLDSYYLYLLECIKEFKAWSIIDLDTADYSFEAFDLLKIKEKIRKVEYVNGKYKQYLKFQKLADIREYFKIRELTEENIEKMKFTIEMFDSFKNIQVKKEFFCFDRDFLITLIAFNKSKKIRLDDYMKSKSRAIQEDYERYLLFYKLEDFREIIEKVSVTSKTAKISVSRVVDIFKEISETDAEIEYVKVNGNEIKKIEKKLENMTQIDMLHKRDILSSNKEYLKKTMSKIISEASYESVEQAQEPEKLKQEERQTTENKNSLGKLLGEMAKNKKITQEEKAEVYPISTTQNDIVVENNDVQLVEDENDEEKDNKNIFEKVTDTLSEINQDSEKKPEKVDTLEERRERGKKRYNTEKEPIIPLIFSWFERDEITFTRRVTIKKLNQFFEKIKKLESENDARVALYLITNASKEITLKRIIEMQKKAINNDLPELIEGALGGYSSFKVETNGRITNLSVMSGVNREKIINLLDNTIYDDWGKDKVDSSCEDFVRYQFADKKEKKFTAQYLKNKINDIFREDKVKNQPLRFIPYCDKGGVGVDVVLKSQLGNISKLSDYYKKKYYVLPEKVLKLNMETFEKFIEN